MKEKRMYRSVARQAQAQATRSAIIQAAKTLFLLHGFEKVTLSWIAKEAAVAVPTIYAQFRSKKGVLQALLAEALPQEKFEPLVKAVENEKDPRKKLQISAKMARSIYDAEKELAILMGQAMLSIEEIQNEVKRKEERRFVRQGAGLQQMWKEGRLKEGLSFAQAKDILWALTGRDLYRLLVVERGWSSEVYEKWLGDTLVVSLLTHVPHPNLF